ncbi:DMBT1 protein, partial [Polypterus senegalus]|nr:DMBT1 protein [Polypterus senegalus]
MNRLCYLSRKKEKENTILKTCSEDSTQEHCPGQSGVTVLWSSSSFSSLTYFCFLPELRLVGGSNSSGRVEIKFNGSWGTVCDDSWDLKDAQVVCRQLGCGKPVSADLEFGGGIGIIWLNKVNCIGIESFLWDCPHAPVGLNDCRHKEDAGVTCRDSQDLKLVNGRGPCEGRVEVLRSGQWGTVCGGSSKWDMKDAAVVCRQLGCGKALTFGEGTGPVLMSNVNCNGQESALKDCQSRTFFCDHYYDVSVVCSGTSVRLIGGSNSCSGRLEVLRDYSWKGICEANFDQKAAEVVCQELKCGAPKEYQAGMFGQGRGSVWKATIQCIGNETNLFDCPYSTTSAGHCATERNDVGLVCVPYRLVNGSSSCSGRVELYYGRQWGTICDRHWDLQDASVFCNQKGCGYAIEAPGQARFGKGQGKIWRDNLQCEGNESDLTKCPAHDYGEGECTHRNDAGVICSGENFGVRLSGGPSRYEGWVEVYYNKTWARVVSESWSDREATVVCRQLGCGSRTQSPNPSKYKKGNRTLCLKGLQCSGSEEHLRNCSHPQVFKCGDNIDAAALCADHLSLMLADGRGICNGRLEIFYNGSWGTVCDDSWDVANVNVVCRQLQCKSPANAIAPVSYGPGNGHIWLDDVHCKGNESSLLECGHQTWGQHNCRHKEDVGVKPHALRLVGGTNNCSGRVELQYGDTWGTVCDDDWDLKDVEVVCRQLQCGKAVTAVLEFGGGNGIIWLNKVRCRGSEAHLWDCRHEPLGKNDCEHKEDAGVYCSGFKILRLTNGCSGQLQVFYNNSWGSVCANKMDETTATIICRELGCGTLTSTIHEEVSNLDPDPKWLDNVKCRGHEASIWQCPSSPWGQNACTRSEVANFSCSGKKKCK